MPTLEFLSTRDEEFCYFDCLNFYTAHKSSMSGQTLAFKNRHYHIYQTWKKSRS